MAEPDSRSRRLGSDQSYQRDDARDLGLLAAVDLLRRVLILGAIVWAVSGAAIAVAPAFVLETVFGLPPLPDAGYVRVAGVFSVSLAMLMVMIARRLEDLWWFSWAFVLASAGSALVATLDALIGLPKGTSTLLWWLFAAVSTAFTVGLLAGLARTGTERPPS
jgi:hypothetical protein